MTKPMTDAEMLAKLEKVIRLDNAWIESTDPELMGNEMDALQRWDIEDVIDSLRVRGEADKLNNPENWPNCPVCNTKEKMWVASQEYSTFACEKCKVIWEDKDHA